MEFSGLGHWNVTRLKTVISEHFSGCWGEDIQNDGNNYLCIRVADFNFDSQTISSEDNTYRHYTEKQVRSTSLKNNDLLLEKSGGSDKSPVGRVVVYKQKSNEVALFANFCECLRIKKDQVPQFIAYLLKVVYMKTLMRQFYNQTTGLQNIDMSRYLGMKIILPPLDEQELIVAYLNQKVNKIDVILSEKEAMVEQMQQYRKSLISETVTRGLNPNVPMTDSGIDWIGQIPAHWVMVRLKYISNLQSGSNLTSEQIEETGEYPVFGGNGLRGYYHDFNTEGDRVLIGRQGALCGNINYASGKFWATEHAVVCHPIKQYNVMWLGSLLEIMNLNQYSIASAQPGLSVDRIKQLEIPLPPFEEQEKIGSIIEKKDSDIKRTISELQSQIEDLRLYKSSIITEAVTGKVDLRDWKPSEENA